MKKSIIPVLALLALCAGELSAQQQGNAKAGQANEAVGEIPEYGSLAVYQKGVIDAMVKGNWKRGAAMAGRCIELYAERLEELSIDDKFGWFYYQKGVNHVQLREYEEAIEAFQTCYSKFPGDANEFGKMALFGLGEAQVGAGKYDEALVTFGKFIRERRTGGRYPETKANTGLMSSLMAQCYFLGSKKDFKKGLDGLSSCLSNRYSGTNSPGVADKDILDAVVVMVNTAFKENKTKEALAFLRQYPSAIDVGAERLAPFVGSLANTAKLAWDEAGKAWEAKNDELADTCLQIFSIFASAIPSQADVSTEIKATLQEADKFAIGSLPRGSYMGMAYVKSFYQNALKAVEGMKDPLDTFPIILTGGMHANVGSLRVTNASYRLLDEYYPSYGEKGENDVVDRREQNLFQLGQTSWWLGDYERGLEYFNRLLTNYPQSEYRPQVEVYFIENMLKDRKFEECLVQAKKLQEINKANPESQFYILARYGEAMSLYSLRRYDEAIKTIEAFLDQYKDSPNAAKYHATVLYALGDSYFSVQNYGRATQVLTDYIAKYSGTEDTNLPGVYFLRAFSYYALIQDNENNTERAYKDSDYIIENFKDSEVYPMALNLKATLLYQEEKLEESNKYCLMAFEAAQKVNNKNVASEALYNLISNLSAMGDENKAEAQKYCDLFWKECDSEKEKNPFALKVALAQMNLYADGSEGFEPAAQKFREIIVREGRRNALDVEVERAIGSYTEKYLEVMEKLGKPLTQEEAKVHFYQFPGVTTDEKDLGIRTMLRTALIGVYQKMLASTDAKDAAKKADLQGAINVFFKEMERDFKPENLTTYTLMQLGNHLLKPEQSMASVPYFNEVIKRNRERVSEAVFGKAIALGLSKDKGNIDQAISMITQELEKEKGSAGASPEKQRMLADAQYYLCQFYFDKGDYKKALEQTESYLADRALRTKRLDVQFIQAETFEKMEDIDSALTTYLNIYSANKGRISSSAPAVQHAMELYWNRNRPKPNNGPEDLVKSSDRHLAWKLGADYIKQTEPFFREMAIEDRNKWRVVQELTEKYYTTEIQQEDKVITERREALKAARRR